MRSSHLLSILVLAGGAALLSLNACSTTDETTEEGAAGAGGSAAGAGGSAAGSGGSTAGSGGSTAGSGGSTAGAGGSAAGAGGSAAGAGGSAAGAGGSAAGAGGSAAGAGGSAAGAGGEAGAGGSAAGAGGEGGSAGGGQAGTKLRVANMVTGYKQDAIDICIKKAGDDWANVQPLFKSSGKDATQFFSPTVSIWLDVVQTGDLEFRFVKANGDCSTKINTNDFAATINENEYHTMVLAGSVVAPTSDLVLFDIPPTPAGKIAAFNGISNAGTGGVDFVTISGTTPTPIFSGVKPFQGAVGADAVDVTAGDTSFGVRRADTGLVLAFTGATINDAKDAAPGTFTIASTSSYTMFTSGTNENAEKASNNLPWFVICDDASSATISGSDLVAACNYSQGRQFGYAGIK